MAPFRKKEGTIWNYGYHQADGKAIDFLEKILTLNCALDLDASPWSLEGQSVLLLAFFSVIKCCSRKGIIFYLEDPNREKKWDIIQKLVENCSDCNPNFVTSNSISLSKLARNSNFEKSYPLLIQLMEKTTQTQLSTEFLWDIISKFNEMREKPYKLFLKRIATNPDLENKHKMLTYVCSQPNSERRNQLMHFLILNGALSKNYSYELDTIRYKMEKVFKETLERIPCLIKLPLLPELKRIIAVNMILTSCPELSGFPEENLLERTRNAPTPIPPRQSSNTNIIVIALTILLAIGLLYSKAFNSPSEKF